MFRIMTYTQYTSPNAWDILLHVEIKTTGNNNAIARFEHL